MSRGMYRTPVAGGLPGYARVADGDTERDISEALYRTDGYLPFFESLPWKEDYLAAKAAGFPKKSRDRL
jgi:hypothetical protein